MDEETRAAVERLLEIIERGEKGRDWIVGVSRSPDGTYNAGTNQTAEDGTLCVYRVENEPSWQDAITALSAAMAETDGTEAGR